MGKVDSGKTETLGAKTAVSTRLAPELADVELPSRFTLRRVLGAGAMGYVVEAHDESLGRDVAVKVLTPKRFGDARSRDRFLREARAVAALRHDHIVTIHDLDPRGQFIVMELVRGDTLKSRIERSGKLEPAEVRRIGAALLDALATAHAAGFVHRDVKPANVLLGDNGAVKLVDFGVAATTDSELTATGEVIGTPVYMAPEQLRGHGNDPRVDIYATGATLFEAATGERLHVGRERSEDPRERILATVADRGLAEAIARAVRDKPSERFSDVREFSRALLAPVPLRRRRLVQLAAVAALAIAAGVGVAITTRGAASHDELALGIAALERQDLTEAAKHLSAAPESPRAHYYRAVLGWWSSRPTAEVTNELDRALAGGIDDRSAGIARAVRALVELQFPAVIAQFEQLRARYPDDREVLYGLFEALFHGGHPDQALEVFHHLREVAPSFGLGRHHALTYYLSAGDVEPARSALAGADGIERVRWQARIDAAAGNVAAALRGLDTARATATGADADTLGWERVALDAQTGDLEHAHTLARELAAKNLQTGALPLYALALARGITDGPDGSVHLAMVAFDAARLPPSILVTTREAWLDLAAFIAIDNNRDRARTALDNLPKTVDGNMIEVALSRVLMNLVVADRKTLSSFAVTSPFPAVRTAAEAALAELAGDWNAAAESWNRARAQDGFGRFHIAFAIHIVRARLALGDLDSARTLCEAVIEPPLFHWSWAAALAECKQITATRTQP